MNIREDISQYIIEISSNKKNVIHKIINDELNLKDLIIGKNLKIVFLMKEKIFFKNFFQMQLNHLGNIRMTKCKI